MKRTFYYLLLHSAFLLSPVVAVAEMTCLLYQRLLNLPDLLLCVLYRQLWK